MGKFVDADLFRYIDELVDMRVNYALKMHVQSHMDGMFKALSGKLESIVDKRLKKDTSLTARSSLGARSNSMNKYLKPELSNKGVQQTGGFAGRSSYSRMSEESKKKESILKEKVRSLAAPPPGKAGDRGMPEPFSVTAGEKPRKSLLSVNSAQDLKTSEISRAGSDRELF